ERKERAHGEERDEPIRHAAEKHEQPRGQRREEEDAARVDEAWTLMRERAGEETVDGEGPTEPWKAGKTRARRQTDDRDDRRDRDVVSEAPAEHRRRELRQDALVAGAPRGRRPDAEESTRQGDADEEQRQRDRDGGERP